MNNEVMVTFKKKDGKRISLNPKEVTSLEEGAHGLSITTTAQESFYLDETFDEVLMKIQAPRKKYMRPRPS